MGEKFNKLCKQILGLFSDKPAEPTDPVIDFEQFAKERNLDLGEEHKELDGISRGLITEGEVSSGSVFEKPVLAQPVRTDSSREESETMGKIAAEKLPTSREDAARRLDRVKQAYGETSEVFLSLLAEFNKRFPELQEEQSAALQDVVVIRTTTTTNTRRVNKNCKKIFIGRSLANGHA